MSRKVFVTGGGGGGGSADLGSLVVDLPLVSATALGTGGNNLNVRGESGITQLNANQFGWVAYGADNPSNVIRLVAVPFQVDNNGAITPGSAVTTTNSSGVSISNTVWYSECAPGRFLIHSACHWAGSYNMMAWTASVASNNTAVVGRDSGGAISGTYFWPGQYNCVPTGNGSFVFSPSYNNSSYSGYMRYDWNGSTQYNYGTSSALNSYSSTVYGYPAIQNWQSNQARCGLIIDHRSSSSGFYVSEAHTSNSFTGYGYMGSVFGNEDYSTILGHRLASGKAVYFNQSRAALVTDGAGGTLKTNTTTPIPANLQYGRAGATAIALGNDYFAAPQLSGASWLIYKVTVDGANNPSTETVASLFTAPGLVGSPASNATGWRFGGDENQFLVQAAYGQVNVYDATALKALMV